MSGGAFNYLYQKELEHYVSYQVPYEDFENMLAELLELCPEAAKELLTLKREAISFRDSWEARMRRLQPILHDIEWWRSGDSSKDAVDKSIREYLAD